MSAPASPLESLDRDLLGRLLETALARGGDYADIFAEWERLRTLRWEEGQIKEARASLGGGVGIRVLAGEQTGYATSEDWSPPALLAAAATAAHIAAGGAPPARTPLARLALPDRYPLRRPFDAETLETRHGLLAALEAEAAGGEVERVQASYTESDRALLVATSEGVLARDRQPLLRLNCSVVAARDGRRETGSASAGGRAGLEFFAAHPPAAVAAEARRLALLALAAGEAPAGPMPVVLGPAASGILLHEAVGHGLEADFNRKGTSKFSGRLGQRVASERCTVVDDATLAGDRGALNVDDEGTPAGRTVLIENGILKGYLHDRLSSRAMGLPRTGNGRRESFRHHPLPRMTCTYLLPGESSLEAILAATPRGLYARQFSGGQVDIARGDFVFDVTEGYLIEGGAIGRPVRGATLIGNGPDIMGRVSLVAADFALSPGMWTCGKRGQTVPVNVGLPHLKIDEIVVGGTRTGGA
ncbi:metalloprotease TldD [bacterium]|nr:metalloprotease TldD [bacterium]